VARGCEKDGEAVARTMIDIGKRLRELRKARRLSQRDISRRTGLMVPYVSFIETGRKVPLLPMIERLAKALHVPLYQIFLPEGAVPLGSPLARFSEEDTRLYRLLSRMDEMDQRLFLSLVNKMAKRGGKHGRTK
jgi:transcriptional regulator with XRE-family HTH domain